ncbi:response regulator transcription factor [Gallaecimonas sp. GXIMD4217]|uniref:response regulator transcription factor n=1 Tax=Gallaecimonas sp. GXIMD4217 TaxID=3131927 RepID=UPI00311B0AB4
MPEILIADDHPLFRSAIRLAIESQGQDLQVRECCDADSLFAQLDGDEPDLVLLDLTMPGAHGFSCLLQLRERYPALPVVIISAHEDDQSLSRAHRYGALGFIPKSADLAVIGDALASVLAGELWYPDHFQPRQQAAEEQALADGLAALTPQQYKVLALFAEGLLNKQVAHELEVSEATIKAHATAIFKKLNVRNRTQAVIALQSLSPAAGSSAP